MKLPVGRIRLFGPVLFYDLVCLARRPRYTLLRTLFPLALLILLWFVYQSMPRSGPGQSVTHQDMETMGGAFFGQFLAALFGLALLVTPVYAAGCIAEEKDRRRVDFLFATNLEDQEIVLGKLMARLANLLCLLLASLPIISFIQFWGGVDPELVLVGYAAVGLTLMSTASFSIYQSVRARKARDAIVSTYLFLLAYFGFSSLAGALLNVKSVATYALLAWPRQITVGTLIQALNAGNILFVRGELSTAITAGTRLTSVLPRIFMHYAIFHVFLATTFVAAAILQVRRMALTETLPVRKRSSNRWRPERWLRPGNYPILWKELCIDPGLSFNRAGRALVGLIILGSFVPAVWNLGWLVWQAWFSATKPPPLTGYSVYEGYWAEMLGRAINAWVRQVGIAVACLTILGAAVRAACCVSGEREQETLESLLASPLDIAQIGFAKWLGSMWSVRWGFLWLCLVWTIGIVMGGLNLVVLPWLILCWFVYATFFACLGLWLSVRTNKTLQATVWTLSWTVVLSVGQLLPWLLVGMPNTRLSRAGLDQSSLALFQVYGMSPPLALGWLSFRGGDFRFFTSTEYDAWEILMSISLGLIIWLLGAYVIWSVACQRLARERIDALDRPRMRELGTDLAKELWLATIRQRKF